MPCWMTQEQAISLKSPNMDVFKAALTALDYENFNENNEYARTNGRGAVFTADNFRLKTSVCVMPDGTVKIISGASGNSQFQADLIAGQTRGITRAYGKESVQASAKKFGWKVSWKSETKFELQKR